MSDRQEVIDFLEMLKSEGDVSKRFKEKMQNIICILQKEENMFVEKALAAIEELNTLEMSSYHRTQVWEVASMLESAGR